MFFYPVLKNYLFGPLHVVLCDIESKAFYERESLSSSPSTWHYSCFLEQPNFIEINQRGELAFWILASLTLGVQL